MESYLKIREIGKGSYGVVWLVKQKVDKKKYVLKRIDLRRSSERDKLSAQQEAQLLKTLKHPNIVAYKESFQADGYLNIVMLFCDGGDLYTKIKEQNGVFLEETQIVEWFVQIAMALQYMHDKNILHRDLKTQNIFLTKSKIIKVGDLGIARVLKSNNDMATTIIGTPYYMSPELFSNKPYNSKSDVWALGCCVYEMTTLKHAFNAKDMTSLVFKITRGKMPLIPQHYSKELITLIESMLNLDPQLRPSVNKILRNSYIRKNIRLFLERTKEKQKQYEIEQSKVGKVVEKSEFVNLTKQSKETAFSDVKRVTPKSQSESDLEQQKSQNKLDMESDKAKPSESESRVKVSFELKENSRVRIASVVENLETKECLPLNNNNNNNSNKSKSDEDQIVRKPVVQIVPAARVTNANRLSVNKRDESNESVGSNAAENQPAVFVNAVPVIQANPIRADLNPRERRRQRIRLSQNDSSQESKPPILYNRPSSSKSNKSEVFYISNKNNKSEPSLGPKKEVSKSYDDHKANKHMLQDSLKIIRQNIVPIKSEPQKMNMKPIYSPSNYDSASHSENEAKSSAKQDAKSSIVNSSSSSSTSIASSDDDPVNQILKVEKNKKKVKKEMDNFIDKLSSTLNAVNLSNDSVVDDLKEEILEDLEEEAFEQQQQHKEKKSVKFEPSAKVVYEDDFIDAEYESIDDKEVRIDKPSSTKPNINSNNAALSNATSLGTTNHMHQRVNSIENELVEIIGNKKLEQAMKIYEKFKDNEIDAKLSELIGKELYETNKPKLWLYRFCKETIQISKI